MAAIVCFTYLLFLIKRTGVINTVINVIMTTHLCFIAVLTVFGKEIETVLEKLMRRRYLAVLSILLTLLIISCSKKQVPQQTTTAAGSPAAKKPVAKKTAAAPVARVIIVNDAVAKKSFDGKLYYDVDGHRYWRNYNDGKYYLFNKSMYSDPAFKPH